MKSKPINRLSVEELLHRLPQGWDLSRLFLLSPSSTASRSPACALSCLFEGRGPEGRGDCRSGSGGPLKQNTLARDDLDDFVACYRPGKRYARQPTWSEKTPDGRWRGYAYDELLARDKVSLDLFWLRDESLEDSANLPDPDVIAEEIAEDLRTALAEIEDILDDLKLRRNGGTPSEVATASERPAPQRK